MRNNALDVHNNSGLIIACTTEAIRIYVTAVIAAVLDLILHIAVHNVIKGDILTIIEKGTVRHKLQFHESDKIYQKIQLRWFQKGRKNYNSSIRI